MARFSKLHLLQVAQNQGMFPLFYHPVSLYGPGFVKAIIGPQPRIQIIPMGGVSPDRVNFSAWFEAKLSCMGMGSKLITKKIVKNRDFSLLEKNTQRTLNLIQEIRNGR
ncbi:MAG: hypothetical protein R8P61_06515 [Bacteroidia bacterium]|nr:hypothetical protein [Bacteroidia bacterium]